MVWKLVLGGIVLLLVGSIGMGYVPADKPIASYTLHVSDTPRTTVPADFVTYQSLSAEEQELFRQAYKAEPGFFGDETIWAAAPWAERATAPAQTFVETKYIKYRGRFYPITAARSYTEIPASEIGVMIAKVSIVTGILSVFGGGGLKYLINRGYLTYSRT